MRVGRRRFGPALLALAAWSGAVVGHALTYVLLVPNARARAAVLAETGHSYWWTAIAAAIVFAVVATAVTVIREFASGLGRPHSPTAPVFWQLAWRLALLQSVIFVTQESLERVAVGIPIGVLLSGRVLPVGVVLQCVVACAAAALLAALARVAHAAGRLVAERHPHVRRPAVRAAAPARIVRARPAYATAAIRAPPLRRI